MKQAQAMQQRMAEAQERIAALEVQGTSGGGMVTVTLKGTGEMSRVVLDEKQAEVMREAAGPLAGMNIPGMPKF